jgi:hypothetical protein
MAVEDRSQCEAVLQRPDKYFGEYQGGGTMADDRERNQGMKQGTGQTGHQAPGRNPQDDRTAGERGDKGRQQGSQEPGQGAQENKQAGQRDFDPSRGGDGGNYKEGGQNEQSRR